jgi:hypothetical protein
MRRSVSKEGTRPVAKAVDPRQLALQALSRAVADPAPKVLFGSAKAPGFFTGSGKPAKQAAQYCQDQGWLEGTGRFEGKGKSRKELFRVSPAGIKEALANSEPVVLLGDARSYLEQNVGHLRAIKTRIDETLPALEQHRQLVDRLLERLKPPELERLLQAPRPEALPGRLPTPPSDWLDAALDYLRDYRRRNPLGDCPLPDLFHHVAEPRSLTIGQFHDGLRRLVQHGQVRLHPFTGAAYTLKEEQYALVAGQEIKYYAEPVASP